jgi:dimethylaniline monooxygenase (N-oxide forming)
MCVERKSAGREIAADYISSVFLQPLGIVSRIYQFIQILISLVFSPLPPPAHPSQRPLGHVAVIGAGVTGVASASHLIGHGFEVTIFEQGE